jgi:uncharacterized protein (TIGR03067 family)
MTPRFILILAVAGLLAADTPRDDANKEKRKIQATWQCTAAEVNGRKAPEAEISTLKLIFSGEEFTFKLPDGDVKGNVKMLDTTTDPRLIDLDFKVGPIRGTLEGIYKVDGDTLTLCLYSMPDVKQRPGEFTGKEGSNQFLLVFRREKQ